GTGPAAGIFAVVEFALAVFSYVAVETLKPLAAAPEAWLLGAMIIAASASAYAGAKATGKAEAITMGTLAVIMPLFGRFGAVTLTGYQIAPTIGVSIT